MKTIFPAVGLVLLSAAAFAQKGNFSIGASTPSTKLDVNGAVTYREASLPIVVSDTTVAIPHLTHSQFRLVSGTASFTITGPVSSSAGVNLVAGARMVLINHTLYTGTLNGFPVVARQAKEFVYSNQQWTPLHGADPIGLIDNRCFASLAVLKAQKSFRNGAVYTTAGYYSAGDGGGLKYYFDSASSAVADSGSVLKPIGLNGAGRLIAMFDDKVSPKCFGAKANGQFDDTRAIQMAVDYSILHKKTLFFSSPGVEYNSYIVTNTIEIVPPHGQTLGFLNIESQGNALLQIQYRGGSNKAVFHVLGLKSSKITGLSIAVKNGASNIICWDIATSDFYGSTSFVTFENCMVLLESGVNNVGWRMGHISTDPSGDISEYVWINCIISGEKKSGQTGYLVEGGNTLGLKWYGGYGYNLDRLYSNLGTAGATNGSGNGAVYFYGLGGHDCNTYFTVANIETYYISGGRFELGKRFLTVMGSSNHPSIVCSGLQITALTPDDGHLFVLESPCTLIMDGCIITQGSYNEKMIVGAGFQNKGNIQVRGGAITATEPFYTVDALRWKVYITGVGKSDGYGTPTYFNDRNPTVDALAARLAALEN